MIKALSASAPPFRPTTNDAAPHCSKDAPPCRVPHNLTSSFVLSGSHSMTHTADTRLLTTHTADTRRLTTHTADTRLLATRDTRPTEATEVRAACFVKGSPEATVLGLLRQYFYHSRGPWPASHLDCQGYLAIADIVTTSKMRHVQSRAAYKGAPIDSMERLVCRVAGTEGSGFETDGVRVRPRACTVDKVEPITWDVLTC